MTALVLAELAGLLVIAGVAVLEEGETPLAAWKRKVAAAVERYVEREGTCIRGDAVNADGRLGAGTPPAVTATERTTCPPELYPE